MSRFTELLRQSRPDDLEWIEERPELPGPSDRPRVVSSNRFLAPDLASTGTDWSRGFTALQKHWRKSVIFAVSVMTAVLLITVLTKPVYTPIARVEVDPPGAELFSLEGRSGPESAPDYLETQARNMQSDQLLISVMRQLQLEQLPEFKKKGLVSRALGATASAIDHVPAWLWRSDADHSVGSADAENLSAAQSSTLRTMQERLSVERDTSSRLIHISFTTHDPVLSATITNTLVHSFIERSYETRHAAVMESTVWLSRQLDDIRAKMETSNRTLANFQRISGIADIDQNRSTVSERVGELSRQKTQAQTERVQIEAYLRKARDGQTGSLPQVQNNQVVQLLSQKLGDTRAELSQTLAIYGKNHPNAKKLENQAQELESQIQLQHNAIVAEMETSYAAAMFREQMLDGQLRGTTRELGQMAQYSELKRETLANAELYNALYARVKEAGIAAASKSINVRVIDEARVLDRPSSPQPLVNLGIGICVALLGGVLLAFVFEVLDTKVRTLEDVKRSIGVNTISMIPIAERNGRSSLFGSLSSAFGSHPRLLEPPAFFLLDQPASEQSEAFRGIQTSLMFSRPGAPPRILLVVSSLPGEGKTTVAINLAAMLAQRGKTCILDADLRRPAVARAFHLSNRTGLSEYLSDSVPLETLFSSAPDVPGLTIIAGGKSLSDPGRFASAEKMRALLQKIGRLHDFVVIDSAPILPYADGRVLAALADGIIFVARAGEVTRSAISRSMELLEQVHSAPIIEVVLNGASIGSAPYGYGYHYQQSA